MARTLLSVNINKYALVRNSRGHDSPNLLHAARLCIEAGCHGITVHPRRDQRHVRYSDLRPLAEWLGAEFPKVELNIECEAHPEVLDHVLALRPAQCTLVPVTPGEVTSDHGWRLPEQAEDLIGPIRALHAAGVRVSLFADCEPASMPAFAAVGADRVELYTGPYAWAWGTAQEAQATSAIYATAAAAAANGLGVNAGHDLDRHNLVGLRGLSNLLEVSIGHAQVCRALEVGTHQSVRELLDALGH